MAGEPFRHDARRIAAIVLCSHEHRVAVRHFSRAQRPLPSRHTITDGAVCRRRDACNGTVPVFEQVASGYFAGTGIVVCDQGQ